MDKELEIDEFLRSAIQNQEHEKKVRELYEKAYGLDYIKPKYQESKDKLKAIESEYGQLSQSLRQLGKYLNAGDYDSFFNELGIPLDSIYQWVLGKVQYSQLPPEQRQAHDQAQLLRQQQYQLERQNEILAKQYEDYAVQAKTREIKSLLESENIRPIAQAFDAYAAKEGLKFPDGSPVTFYGEVVIRGRQLEAITGEDVPAEQVVRDVAALYRPLVSKTASPQAASVPQAQAATTTQDVPVIPVVTGRSTSPTKKSPKSLEELRKLAASL